MKLVEAIALLTAVGEQATKAQIEIVAKLGELQSSVDNLNAALASVDLTEDQAAAVVAVVNIVQELDDIIPDAPVADPVAADPAA